MFGRMIAVLFGLAGAAAGSQAPSFTLQYMQNLTGRIDELRPVVERFDESVGAIGYSRETALAECEISSGLLQALCNAYVTTVRRYEELVAHKEVLAAAGDLPRPLVLARAQKPEISRSVLEEYQPAFPATVDGAVYAGGGFAVLWGGLSFFFGLLGALFGRR